MNAHILQHVSFEDISSIASWLKRLEASVTYTRLFRDEKLPQIKDCDLIVIVGGPMSVNDEAAFPWLRAEKEFIRAAIASGTAVLGICLGAQLIANALGALVYKNPQKEIGWFPVEAVPHLPGAFNFPKRFTAFHWHGETFDLPSGAVWLARNEACKNQAFQIGSNVIGLQFHLEATADSVKDLLDNCADELIPGSYIQTKSTIQKAGPSTYAEINYLMDNILSFIYPSEF